MYMLTAEGLTSYWPDLVDGLFGCGWEVELATEGAWDEIPCRTGVEKSLTGLETSEAVSRARVVSGFILMIDGLNDTHQGSGRMDWACGDNMPWCSSIYAQPVHQVPLTFSLWESSGFQLHVFIAWFWRADVLWSAENKSEKLLALAFHTWLYTSGDFDWQLDEAFEPDGVVICGKMQPQIEHQSLPIGG